MSSDTRNSVAPDARAAARLLLETIESLAEELYPRRRRRALTLDSLLDSEAALDSLGRAELIARLERLFEVGLPDEALLAQTPRELLAALLTASGAPRPETVARLKYAPPAAVEAAPAQATTLIEALEWHVQAHPDRVHVHLLSGEEEVRELTYRELMVGARRAAAALVELGIAAGDRVAIMLPTGADYLYSFFGTLLAGAVPVPLYPPVRPSQLEDHLRRQRRILENAGTPVMITMTQAKPFARLLASLVPTLRHLVTEKELGEVHALSETALEPRRRRAEDLAFLQYTSGSTGQPKGVMLTHSNLLSNLRAIGARVQAGSTDVFVSWLPLYHDMGLIGAWLGSLYFACTLVLMSPLDFLLRPARWLRAIHRYGGTISASPNFGYELCLNKVDAEEIEGVDLGSLRLAFSGAEPVSAQTITDFIERFRHYGFRREAMMPVYGLAESSVGLTVPSPGHGPVIDRLDREIFTRTGEARLAPHDSTDAIQVVACGAPIPGEEVRIVDARGVELPERQEGELEFRGPSATSGYFHNPEATRELFDGTWRDSGDRAYIAAGDVYITGRLKDVIIRGGRNIHPPELDEAVGNISGIRKGCVACFGCTAAENGPERLIVAAETGEEDPAARERLHRAIVETTMDVLDLPPDEIVLVAPHSIPKTSSGKIRRAATRELYAQGALGRETKLPALRLARLALTGLRARLRRAAATLLDVLYNGYAWTLFALLALPAWLGLMLLPTTTARWRLMRGAGRILARASGTRLVVRGLGNLPRDESFVLVANHASYLDAILLVTALPTSFRFVAKRELATRLSLRLPLRRIGTVFIERFDLRRSAEEAGQVIAAIRQGDSLAVFPEGTFDRMPGLLPFHMGGFVAAVQTGCPVVPVAIRGTRSKLRDGSWFVHRGMLQVIVGRPIRPDGDDWQAALRVRDAARVQILRHCGESDVGAGGEVA